MYYRMYNGQMATYVSFFDYRTQSPVRQMTANLNRRLHGDFLFATASSYVYDIRLAHNCVNVKLSIQKGRATFCFPILAAHCASCTNYDFLDWHISGIMTGNYLHQT